MVYAWKNQFIQSTLCIYNSGNRLTFQVAWRPYWIIYTFSLKNLLKTTDCEFKAL